MGLKTFNHVDLFSGIGGFALAARNVWGKEYNNVCFCEINKYAQAVLRKNFGKDVVICDDIRKLTADSCRDGQFRIAEQDGEAIQPGLKTSRRNDSNGCDVATERIDLLTGGFPCQPFSQAGQRRGTEDDRFLWPEMLRVISEFRPTWIIGENVAGLLSMAEFDGEPEVDSQTDLFGNSIDVHTKSGRGILFRIIGELEQIGYSVQTFVIPACAVNAPHRRDRVWIVAHSEGTKRESKWRTSRSRRTESGLSHWGESWLSVATRTCVRRVDDGVSRELYGLELTSAGHRVERLKALGNAIVPQVAEQIMKSIKEIEQC